jgi:hypothetical protein
LFLSIVGCTVTIPLKVVVSFSGDMYISVSSMDFGTTVAFYLGVPSEQLWGIHRRGQIVLSSYVDHRVLLSLYTN